MSRKSQEKFREFHRYLGFFLAGIMAVYAFSGIVLTFRNTDTFKKKIPIEKTLEPGLDADNLGQALGMRVFVEKSEADLITFNNGGTYSVTSGIAKYNETEY